MRIASSEPDMSFVSERAFPIRGHESFASTRRVGSSPNGAGADVRAWTGELVRRNGGKGAHLSTDVAEGEEAEAIFIGGGHAFPPRRTGCRPHYVFAAAKRSRGRDPDRRHRDQSTVTVGTGDQSTLIARRRPTTSRVVRTIAILREGGDRGFKRPDRRHRKRRTTARRGHGEDYARATSKAP